MSVPGAPPGGGHRGPDPAAEAPAAAGNPFAPSPAPTPPRPTTSRASTPVPRSSASSRAPATPVAADVLGELRDVFDVMGIGNGEGDEGGDNKDNESDDALSACGPDEVIARNPPTPANRWPDGGEAAHPVRRPPEPGVLFPPGSSPPGASRPDENDDDAASFHSMGTVGDTSTGGRSSPPPAEPQMPRPSAPASAGLASEPSWHNTAGQTQGIGVPGTHWPPRTATYPDLQGPPHPLLQAQLGFAGGGGPVPPPLLQQPDLHAYMLQPFPQHFPQHFALNTPRGDAGGLAQDGGVPSGGPGAPVDDAPVPGPSGQEPTAGRQEEAQVHGARGAAPGGGEPRPPGGVGPPAGPGAQAGATQ